MGWPAEQVRRPAFAQPVHDGGGIADRAECGEQRLQLRGDLAARIAEECPGASGQHAAVTAPVAVDLATAAAFAAGVVESGSSSAGTADQLAVLIAADERPHDLAAGTGSRMPTDVLVAADTDWPDGPFRLDRAAPAAPEAWTGRSGPATAADRAAGGNPLAGPGFPADRAGRRRSLVAAVAQVRAVGSCPFGDLPEAPAAPARTLRLLVARCADRARIGGSGDGARLAAGRAGASRARRAGLAAGAAVGHACGGPPAAAASAAVFKHLFVLGVAGRADPALVAPGVDALELAAPGACSGTATRRAGCAYPASGGLAPQIGGDLATSGADGEGSWPVPGLF